MSLSPVQSGAGTGWRKAGSPVPSPYTPATKVAGVEIAEPSSSAPRVPVSPFATVSHVSTSRSRNGSKPLTSNRHPGSSVGSGKLVWATISRMASWSCRMSRNLTGPPPPCSTGEGTPAGSCPTLTNTDRCSSGMSIAESVPCPSATGPKESPTTSTSSGARPRPATRTRATACMASALPVRPRSMCRASLVTAACATPASRTRSRARRMPSSRPPGKPAAFSRASTSRRSSSADAPGGPAQSGSRSSERRFKRSRTRSTCSPADARRRHSASAASSRPSYSDAVARQRSSRRGPAGPTT